MSAHPEFADAIAAYALGALGAPGSEEARALEVHLSTCADCRAELAELQRVVGGIGLSAVAEEPPARLRAAVLNRATQSNQVNPANHKIHRNHSNIVPWMLAAASIALVAATGFYAMMQRQRVVEALNGKTAADARVASLQQQINGLSERIAVLSAPDAVQIKLAGQPDAPRATASVVMSPTKGMVLTALNLPQLATGKIYQLWVVTKRAPVSIGTFEVAADGSVSGSMPLTEGAAVDPVAIAVTIEPAGGVPSPTGPKVLVGAVSPQ
jgi:anti-sigma-K factor RskA